MWNMKLLVMTAVITHCKLQEQCHCRIKNVIIRDDNKKQEADKGKHHLFTDDGFTIVRTVVPRSWII